MDFKVSGQNKLKKVFGIGPTGAAISLLLLAIFVRADSMIGIPIVAGYQALIPFDMGRMMGGIKC